MSPVRLPVALLAAVVLACGVVAEASPAVAATQSATGVTVFLAAPDAAGLTRLAADTALPRAKRLRRLAALLPTAAEHAAAVRALRAEGLTVTRQSAWSVTATGSPDAIERSFGARPVLQPHATTGQFQASTGSLPTVPESLRDVTTAAFPTTGGPDVFHHAAAPALAGSDFRNAYTAATVNPTAGTNPNGPLTIATIQLSNWPSADLAGYAASNGLSLSSGQFTAVQVDGGAGTKPSDYDGEAEVDLDQEAILSTAPTARQRAYFAPNSDAGIANAYSQVLDDVLQDRNAAGGGDPRIVALSSSWGLCEPATGGSAIDTLEPILASLTAAGVTIFGSSGDDGMYDCGETTTLTHGQVHTTPSTEATVDYPASSPSVVAVGGSTLQSASASAPNDGSNWSEVAWSCAGPTDCEDPTTGTGGSGGGASEQFTEPRWQSNDIGNPAYTSVGRRLVPDITADADPSTGFQIYTTDTSADGPCGRVSACTYGGTSLAAPVSASLFTNLLSRYGRTAGIGDIHAGLYAAFAATKGAPLAGQAFRDVTTGTNGADADRGANPSVSATTGYDTVSGLGGVLWPTVAPYLLDMSARPGVSASLSLTNAHSRSHPTQLTASWSVTEAATGVGPASADVQISALGAGTTIYHRTDAASGSVTLTGGGGTTYVLTVTGRDTAGNTTSPVTKQLMVPQDDTAFRFHGPWTRKTGASDFGGTHAVASKHKARASLAGLGRLFELAVREGPAYGKLAVYRGSKRIATIDLFAHRSERSLVPIYRTSSSAPSKQSFTVRPTGKKNRRSSSTRVNVDALYALP